MGLVLEGVNRTVDGEVFLSDINLTFERGEFNVLLGLTEAGKTTLMRIMAGLEPPNSGRVIEDGTDVTAVPVRKRSVGMVYQQFINYPSMTVYDNVASPMRLLGMDRAEIDRRVRETADLMQLTPMLERKPLELSGGQQQRLCIARAIAVNPEVILMDEPASALDPLATATVEELIHELKDNYTIVIVTHNLQQAARVAGYTAFFHMGKIVEFNDTDTLFTNPAEQRTEDYITGRFG